MSAPPGELRERVRRVPGMERLLPALEGVEPAYLVGGAVRDLLRGAVPNDIDIAVEGDARSVGRAVAERLGSDAREYERFGTATVEIPGTTYNFATTREEVYDSPGELPRVSPAPLADDLRRRDFSINAMAVGLTGDDLGHLYDPTGGLADMDARLVRVLHERSFLDDPTRLLRALRYATRLGFALDPETERLAREAVAADALSTVSGARIRDELMDLLGELDAPAGIKRMRELEIHTGLHPQLDPDPELVASASLGAVAIGADRGIAALAALIEEAPEKLDLWLGDLHLPAEARDAAVGAARAARHGAARGARARAGSARAIGADPSLGLRASAGRARDLRDRPARGRRPGGPVRGPCPRGDAEPEARRARVWAGGRAGDRASARPGARAVRLPGAGVTFTTRQGGVSVGPYESLNLGILTADDPERVTENRRRAAAQAGVEPERVAMGWQVHGTALKEWTGPPPDRAYAQPGDKDLEKVDGHLSREPGIGLLVLLADCYPVALSDGEQVAMLHCGWRPLAGGIIEKAVARFAGRPAAAVGPGIGGCCYEVGDEVLEAFSGIAGAASGRMLDLRTVISAQLAAAGVSGVEHVDRCTSCSPDLYFSHRRDNGVTGRQAGIIVRDGS